MVRYNGKVACPKCKGRLIHEYDLANDWVLSVLVRPDEERLICPKCGYARSAVHRLPRVAS